MRTCEACVLNDVGVDSVLTIAMLPPIVRMRKMENYDDVSTHFLEGRLFSSLDVLHSCSVPLHFLFISFCLTK